MEWKQTINRTQRRCVRDLSDTTPVQTARLVAVEKGGDWEGCYAAVDLSIIVHKDGGTMLQAQALLDRVAPLVQQVVKILGEWPPVPEEHEADHAG